MKNTLVLVVLLGSLVTYAQERAGQKPADAPAQAATADDINRLADAMHLKKNMAEMQHTVVDQWAKPMLTGMSADTLKKMTPQQRQKFKDIMDDMMAESFKAYPPDEMIHDMVPIYQKYFDKSDIEAMIAFYSSPTGQKFLDSQSKIMGDFMTVLMPKMQERLQDPMRKMQERIRQMAAEPENEYKPAVPEPKKK